MERETSRSQQSAVPLSKFGSRVLLQGRYSPVMLIRLLDTGSVSLDKGRPRDSVHVHLVHLVLGATLSSLCIACLLYLFFFFFPSLCSIPVNLCHHLPLCSLFPLLHGICGGQQSVCLRVLRNLATRSSHATLFFSFFSVCNSPNNTPSLPRSVSPHLNQWQPPSSEKGPEKLQE